MDISFGIFVLFFALIVVVPLGLYLFTSYEAPRGIGDSLRDTGLAVGAVWVASIAWGTLRTGSLAAALDWELLLAMLAGASVKIGVDWMVLRANRRRESL